MNANSTFRIAALAGASLFTAAAAHAAAAEEYWQWGNDPTPIQEAIFYFGPLPAGETFAGVGTFTLTRSFDLLAHAVTNDAGPLDISQAMVTLWRSNGDEDYGNDVLLGGFDFDNSVVAQRFAGLTRGDYYVLVEGEVSGFQGGSVMFGASLAPVPEPSTYGLMAAGLAVVGWLGRRRSASA
jgi:hypothetical protein